MFVVEVDWVAFCEDGWIATDGKNEHGFLLKVDGKWHVEVANKGETAPYDSFTEARKYIFDQLGIEPASRNHLQALFGAGYRRTPV